MNVRWIGMLAITALLAGWLGMFLWQSTAPPDIAGDWRGEDWGHVVLTESKAGTYTGTFADNAGKGELQLKWSRTERRYNGSWQRSKAHRGKLSVRLVDGKIRGAWTTKRAPETEPPTPRLSDLVWQRFDPLAGNVALSSRGATITGPTSHAHVLLDGKTTGYH